MLQPTTLNTTFQHHRRSTPPICHPRQPLQPAAATAQHHHPHQPTTQNHPKSSTTPPPKAIFNYPHCRNYHQPSPSTISLVLNLSFSFSQTSLDYPNTKTIAKSQTQHHRAFTTPHQHHVHPQHIHLAFNTFICRTPPEAGSPPLPTVAHQHWDRAAAGTPLVYLADSEVTDRPLASTIRSGTSPPLRRCLASSPNNRFLRPALPSQQRPNRHDSISHLQQLKSDAVRPDPTAGTLLGILFEVAVTQICNRCAGSASPPPSSLSSLSCHRREPSDVPPRRRCAGAFGDRS